MQIPLPQPAARGSGTAASVVHTAVLGMSSSLVTTAETRGGENESACLTLILNQHAPAAGGKVEMVSQACNSEKRAEGVSMLTCLFGAQLLQKNAPGDREALSRCKVHALLCRSLVTSPFPGQTWVPASKALPQSSSSPFTGM